MSATAWAPPRDLDALQRRAFAVGGVGTLLLLFGLFLDRDQFLRSYLVAWIFTVGLALGGLAVSMLHHLTRGAWGVMIRRILEASSRTLPALLVLSIPLLLGVSRLYAWARPETVSHDEVLRHQVPYLNLPFFTLRTVFYFAVWVSLAAALSRLSARQDETGEPDLARRMQIVAGPGLAVYCLTATFFAFDWLMSLNPRWASSIFGVYLLGGQALSGLCFAVLVALFLSKREPMSTAYQPRHVHDWGNLLLAFVMLWSYFAISQFLIIWSGDLPEEIGFYRDRNAGGWKLVSLCLVIFHFAVPFVLLLSRALKRNLNRLAAVAALLLVMRWIDLYWLVAPAFHPEGFTFHWLDLAATAAIGGIWVGLFAGQLRKRSLIPVNDPFLSAALHAEGHEAAGARGAAEVHGHG